MKANQRREKIHECLLNANEAITANELAQKFDVSRQVIVGDIALLRARNIDIRASNEGYTIFRPLGFKEPTRFRGKIACQHGPDKTRLELEIILKHGGQVEDVEVDHPVFGVIRAPLIIRKPQDIQQFINSLEEYRAQMLSSLTDGVHLHTINTPSRQAFENIKLALSAEKILLNEED